MINCFLSQMTLKVTQNGTNDLFEAPSDEARPLGTEEWIPLGSIQYGGTTTLNVTLKVPIEMNDEFQDAIGYVDWEFKAEEVPYIPPHDDPSPSPGPGKAVKQPAQPAPAAAPPKTGGYFQCDAVGSPDDGKCGSCSCDRSQDQETEISIILSIMI